MKDNFIQFILSRAVTKALLGVYNLIFVFWPNLRIRYSIYYLPNHTSIGYSEALVWLRDGDIVGGHREL